MPVAFRIMAIAAMLAVGALPPARAFAAAPAPTDAVRVFYDALLVTMKGGAALGQRGRYAKLEPVVRETFDVLYMTQVAAGSAWAALPEASRRELSETFGRYIAATWADRFKSYAGQKLEVTGERPAGAAPLVETRIIKANGEPVRINYLMRRNGDAWRIADVYLNGTISEMATRRSEFTAVLRSHGVDELIRTLNSKVETMLSVELSDRRAVSP
jgi:phospholipid transport system substrate-binding protein